MSNMIKDEAISFVKDYFEKNGGPSTKAVIGISGGKDSAVVAALCVAALGKDRVIGVMMPNGIQKDISDSKRVCDFLGIKNYTINIEDAYKGLRKASVSALEASETPSQFNTNVPARLRMVTLYGVAAMLGDARISCNGNLSERLAGFFTLWGDGAGDFAPLAYLFVEEVIQLGLELGLPEDMVRKAPSDGMCGMTDEEKLGFTYKELQLTVTGKENEVSAEHALLIHKKLDSMAFKRRLLNLPCFIPSFKNPEDWK
ncbi:MAG: NAD(+) synthase [Treponema sp.]|nr:NAD(+) synthase [Treponema sp.]